MRKTCLLNEADALLSNSEQIGDGSLLGTVLAQIQSPAKTVN